jgi:hypothetical protein
VDPVEPVRSETHAAWNPQGNGWGGARWGTWQQLGLLAAAVLLPFGWILPIARFAHVRATTRRRSGLPPR